MYGLLSSQFQDRILTGKASAAGSLLEKKPIVTDFI
jgi:hypothetical protein